MDFYFIIVNTMTFYLIHEDIRTLQLKEWFLIAVTSLTAYPKSAAISLSILVHEISVGSTLFDLLLSAAFIPRTNILFSSKERVFPFEFWTSEYAVVNITQENDVDSEKYAFINLGFR